MWGWGWGHVCAGLLVELTPRTWEEAVASPLVQQGARVSLSLSSPSNLLESEAAP